MLIRPVQLFFAPTRLTLRRTVGVDAVSAEDQASQPLFDLRALSLCAGAPAQRSARARTTFCKQ